MKPRALVVPSEERLDDVCSDTARAAIEKHFTPTYNDLGRDMTADELQERISDAEIVLTSWGSPSVTDEMLVAAPALRAIAHAAGSVKRLVPASVFDRDIAVFSAGPRIAQSVGEYCLAATLTLLRRLPAFHAEMRAGDWRAGNLRGQELTGRRVGIVAASSTARAFLRLLAPFGVEALVYDPYLSDEAAAALGVRRAPLSEVMRCEIVSLHVPNTPETAGLISRELLSSMADGAVLINSARAASVDQDALFDEIIAGRIFAALDVFVPEPAALDERLRAAPNVLLSPHIAGDTLEGHLALMEYVVSGVVGWLDDGRTGPTFVDARAWAIAA